MRFVKIFFSISVFTILAFIAWMVYFVLTPISLDAERRAFDLKAGSHLKAVANDLVQQKILSEPYSFVLLVRALGMAEQIKAGNYLIQNQITPYDLVMLFSQGGAESQLSITFIEGHTFAQMREAIRTNDSIKHLTIAYTDAQILEKIGAKETNAEGLFFPDTYFFSQGMSDEDIFKRAYEVMQDRIEKAWQNRSAGLPYQSPYEALIMASIVEKETGKASERPLIAGVFLNRLRIGMRLQTDPSVIYGIGERYDGNIHKQDLLNDTPYNTYTRDGLPPTPIAMPGLAAIEAALHPAPTKALYFVGKGDGSHFFSNSLEEHNRAVRQYQLHRKAN